MKPVFWRVLTIITVILAIFCLTFNSVAASYATLINTTLGIETSAIVKADGNSTVDTQYFKTAYNSLEEEYQAKADLIRRIAREGTILLKNDNSALPVCSGKVALFGAEDFWFATTHGGGGSMDAKTMAGATGIADALRYQGLTVLENTAETCDAAIVVIGRAAGEGADMPDGALALTDAERERVSSAKAVSDSVILLLSGDFYPEFGEYVIDPEIDAILHIGNAGYRGAYGVADVIAGKVSPSGHTVETVATDSHSSPAMQNFGNYSYKNGSKIMASQAKNYVVYAEGIYADYKYYETRYEDAVLGQGNAASSAGAYCSADGWQYQDEVLYPFGFGLSYTTFQQELIGVTFQNEDHTATVEVKVTNTGTVSGKDVVQVYAQSPYTEYDRTNLVEKSAVQLMGFEKTKELQPGESETVKVIIHMQWLASYDYMNAKTYIMDAGDYYFSIGNGAHEAINNILAAKGKSAADGMDAPGNAHAVYHWHENALDTSTYAVSPYSGESITNRFDDVDLNYWLEDDAKITYLSRSDWQSTWPSAVEVTASKKMMSSLNDKKKYENGIWNDAASRIEVKDVHFAESSDEVLPVIIMRGLEFDDPLWDEVLSHIPLNEASNFISNGRYQMEAIPSLAFPASLGGDSPTGLQMTNRYAKIDHATGEKTEIKGEYLASDGMTEDKIDIAAFTSAMYPSEPVLGATFNQDLAYEQGEMFGEDAYYAGAAFLYCLGCNLHRTPYGGRAAEYYSADPVVTSLMGAAESQGCNTKGIPLVAKHFVANDQEQNRIGIATFLNEQSLRENYLRGVEGIVTYGDVKSVMTTYNRLGLINTSGEYDLLTGMLFGEWGSKCYVITDLNSPTAGLSDGNAAIVAGVSIMLNNGSYDAASGSYVNTTLSPESIKNDPVLLTCAWNAMHRLLYTYVNSAIMNGQTSDDIIVTIVPWWQTALRTATIGSSVLAAASITMYLVTVNGKKKEEKIA